MAKFTFGNDNDSNDPGDFELLDPAWYTFTIIGAFESDPDGNKFVARTGTPFIKVKCVEKETGIRLTHCVFLDPEKTKKVFYFLTAIGLPPQAGEVDIDPSQWTSRMFRGKVEIKNGRNNIVLANPIPSEQPDPTDDLVEYKQPTTTPDPELSEDVPF